MPFGTLDRTPPPFFKQGYSALTRLLFFAALAVFLMVADTRLRLTQPLRVAVATALHPVERALLWPSNAWDMAGDYLGGLARALARESAARHELAQQAERIARVAALERENQRLRALLELRPALAVSSHSAEVLFEAADPYSRKVVIDRGATHGIASASPVINEDGVIGQVTRVYPLNAEVTLITDKDAAIPVLNQRTQQRGVAYGGGESGLELRFMAGNADVQVGDALATSGLDGVYPAGLPVARVKTIERRMESGFALIALAPTAAPDGVRHVLVLEPVGAQLPVRPQAAADAASKPQAAKKGGRK